MLLALDTSTRHISIALHDGQSVAAEHSWRTAGHHTVELAPAVEQMLQRQGLSPRQLSGVAAALGPGSYTGLRIGLGLAYGLALAAGRPLLGVPSLESLMRAQPPQPIPAIGLLQAGRGRVIAAQYRWDQAWMQTEAPRVLDWAGLAASLREATYICGEVDATGQAALQAAGNLARLASPALCLRRAGFLAEIAWERLRLGQADDPARLRPLYAGQLEGAA